MFSCCHGGVVIFIFYILTRSTTSLQTQFLVHCWKMRDFTKGKSRRKKTLSINGGWVSALSLRETFQGVCFWGPVIWGVLESPARSRSWPNFHNSNDSSAIFLYYFIQCSWLPVRRACWVWIASTLQMRTVRHRGERVQRHVAEWGQKLHENLESLGPAAASFLQGALCICVLGQPHRRALSSWRHHWKESQTEDPGDGIVFWALQTGNIPKEMPEVFFLCGQIQSWFCMDSLTHLGQMEKLSWWAEAGVRASCSSIITPAKAGPSGETAFSERSDTAVGLSLCLGGELRWLMNLLSICHQGEMGRELRQSQWEAEIWPWGRIWRSRTWGKRMSSPSAPAHESDLFLQKRIRGTRCTKRASNKNAEIWGWPALTKSLRSE